MVQVNITLSIRSRHGWHFGNKMLEVVGREDIIAAAWRFVHPRKDGV